MSTNPQVTQVLSEIKQNRTNLNHKAPTLNLKGSLKHEKLQVEIQNVVATADLSQRLDLDTILKVTPGATYNPQRFPGLVYKLKKPKTTTLLFGSGKMVCTGARSAKSAKTAIAQVIKELRSQGIIIIANPDSEIENIVASGDLRGTIDLEIVAERLSKTMYEPEQFPGLIYNMNEPKAVLLVFASGRIVCVGAKTESDVNLAIEKLWDTLQSNDLISFNGSPSNEENLTEILSEASVIQDTIRS
jgi:transcription initiation factor TFIID TATA-box-binding protein